MPTLSITSMRQYLRRSISSFNENKLRGVMAEIEFRHYLSSIGYKERVSVGGWILRNTRGPHFGRTTIAVFPQVIHSRTDYGAQQALPPPPGLHAIGSVFHQSGIAAYYCVASVLTTGEPESVQWNCVQLGIPGNPPYRPFPAAIEGFTLRERRYGWLRHNAKKVSRIPNLAVPEEFSKENLRVAFGTRYFAEVSDVDGVFWGRQHTYPLEIKEKTAAHNTNLGEYFGLDLGPFVKLAFYAAKRGNLKSVFVVREIDSEERRNLRQWWFITFEELAQVASWVGLPGGPGMGGGRSAVVRIPKSQFHPLNRDTLALL